MGSWSHRLVYVWEHSLLNIEEIKIMKTYSELAAVDISNAKRQQHWNNKLYERKDRCKKAKDGTRVWHEAGEGSEVNVFQALCHL